MIKHASLISISAPVFKAFALCLMLMLPVSQAIAAPAVSSAKDNAGKIAVVDIQFLVSNSKAGKSVRAQLDKKRDLYRGQIERQEADLRKMEKALAVEQADLSKEEFNSKYRELRSKVDGARLDVQKRAMSLEKAYLTALEKLREHIVKIVADIAGKNDISLVLNRQEVVLVDAKMDITEDVLFTLDKKVTSVPVTVQ